MNLQFLIESMQSTGCPVCRLVQRDVARFFYTLLFEMVNDSQTRTAIQDSQGLCNLHAWQLTRAHEGGVLNIAILYRDALQKILAELTSDGSLPGKSGHFATWLSAVVPVHGEALLPAEQCIVCTTMQSSEKRYVGTLAEYSTRDDVQSAFERSDGLCLPHFRQALESAPDARFREHLLALQIPIWTHLCEELGLFIERQNYQYTGIRMGDEADSWLRAIRALAGEEGIFALDRRP